MSEIVVTRLIKAAPATVYSFFTDLDRWISWQGVGGELEATPGGLLRIRMPGGQVASGQFVELVPERRIVFTWGWEGGGIPVAPGTTRVVVELEAMDGGTLVRLTHHDIDEPRLADEHRDGWQRYLERLSVRAEGGDPGPDAAR
jgi:uncharacterized protein YndB with AHSA1/START domain